MTPTRIGTHSVIGARHVPLRPGADGVAPVPPDPRTVRLGRGCTIGSFVVIYEGVVLGDEAYVDDYCRVGQETRIGARSMLLYGVKVYNNVTIGTDCRIAGFTPGGVVFGDRVTMMGTIAHKYDRPLDWSRDEPSPVFEDDVVVGLGAVIVGGITIGKGSYVAAGSLCTKPVPPESFVSGRNHIVPLSEGPSGVRQWA